MTQPQDGYDARTGSGDPETDPAAMGELSAETPDGDGGAVVADADSSDSRHGGDTAASGT